MNLIFQECESFHDILCDQNQICANKWESVSSPFLLISEEHTENAMLICSLVVHKTGLALEIVLDLKSNKYGLPHICPEILIIVL